MQPDDNSGGSWRKVTEKHRKRPFGVMQRGGQRKSRWFFTESERDAWLEALTSTKSDLSLIADVVRFLEFTGLSREDLPGLATLWRLHGGGLRSIPLSEAIKSYLEGRQGDLGVDSMRHTRKNLSRLAERFQGATLQEITGDMLEKWLYQDLRHFSAYTLRSHRKDVRALFNWHLKRGHVATNPANLTTPPRVVRDRVSVLSPEDCKHLLTAAIRVPGICRLALELFCGVRTSTAALFLPEWVHVEDLALEFPAWGNKTEKRGGTRKYRSGYPETAFTFIENCSQYGWSVSGREYGRTKAMLFRVSEVANPGNVLRHTFASAHYALFGDLHRTADLCLHSSPKTTDDHYAGRYSKADAERLFSLTYSSLQ